MLLIFPESCDIVNTDFKKHYKISNNEIRKRKNIQALKQRSERTKGRPERKRADRIGGGGMIVGQFEIRKEDVLLNGESIPIINKVDVLVIGGGAAGVSAASAAGRDKIPAMVVEKNSFFGGEMSGGGGRPVDGAFPGDRSIGGMMDMLLAPLRFAGKESAVMCYEEERGTLYYHDSQYYKKLAAEMLWKSGCKILLNTVVTDVLAEDHRVKAAIVCCNMRKAAILADAFVDCTDEAVFAAALGIPMKRPDKKRVYSYPYMLQKADCDRIRAYQEEDPRFERAVAEAKKNLDITDTRNAFWKFDSGDTLWQLETDIREGIVYADTIHITPVRPDPLRTGTEAEVLAQVKLIEHIRFFRKYIPGMENVELLQAAAGVIAEENDKIEGTGCFTEEMCEQGEQGEEGIVRFRGKEADASCYALPYQVMVTEQYDNLVVAGKGISAESPLIQKLGCGGRMVMGQCAGVMAARIAKHDIKAAELDGAYLRSRMEELGCDLDGKKTRIYRPEKSVNARKGW